VGKVAQPRECLALVWFDRRLPMRAEQLIALTPEAGECVGTLDPIEIADPASPVDEIEQAL
jgi:hypothetical protein